MHRRYNPLPRRTRRLLECCLLALCGLSLLAPLRAQAPAEYPRTPWNGFPYPASYDAEIADPDVHRVHFENENIMFLEVSNPPGLDVRTHAHPYTSVFARDTGATQTSRGSGLALDDKHMDPDGPWAAKGWSQGGPPEGMVFPRCTTAPPESPHRPINHNQTPAHFYRIEFRRLDGDGLQAHWKEWYPWMLNPAKPVPAPPTGTLAAQKMTALWPYSGAYDEIIAAPNNYQLLFENSHVRLVEVTIRPGETTPMHGHPYPSVLAHDSIPVEPSKITDTKLDASSPLNGQGMGHAGPPQAFDMKAPTCDTANVQAPHSIRNGSDTPLHYYRIEFKRLDGADFATHWREWYPWMKYMQNMRK